jgi:hypothetical protein
VSSPASYVSVRLSSRRPAVEAKRPRIGASAVGLLETIHQSDPIDFAVPRPLSCWTDQRSRRSGESMRPASECQPTRSPTFTSVAKIGRVGDRR